MPSEGSSLHQVAHWGSCEGNFENNTKQRICKVSVDGMRNYFCKSLHFWLIYDMSIEITTYLKAKGCFSLTMAMRRSMRADRGGLDGAVT